MTPPHPRSLLTNRDGGERNGYGDTSRSSALTCGFNGWALEDLNL